MNRKNRLITSGVIGLISILYIGLPGILFGILSYPLILLSENQLKPSILNITHQLNPKSGVKELQEQYMESYISLDEAMNRLIEGQNLRYYPTKTENELLHNK